MHWVVNEQAAVDDVSVGVTVWDRANEDRCVRIRSIARTGTKSARHSPRRIPSYVRARVFLALRHIGEFSGRTDGPLVQLRILAPGENRPGMQGWVKELHGRHVEMCCVAPRKEVQCTGIGGTRI